MVKLTFEDVCRYAEKIGCLHREGPSKATDYTQHYFRNHWINQSIMVLYEAPRRTLKGHDKPEVCWWCISSDGRIHSIPSRHLRMMDEIRGMSIWEEGADMIIKELNNIQEAE